MKTMFKNKLLNTILLASACGMQSPRSHRKPISRARMAIRSDRDLGEEIRILAESDHTQEGRAGHPALSSSDRVHGFMSKPLKIDTDIPADKTEDVVVTPDTAGDFTVICDHYCGTGHGNMKMKVTVVE